jgi:hypothetical protein
VPDESDLRHLLQGPDPEGRAAIDLDAVLTRARRRRRPRVIAAQALGSVALVGVLGTAVVVSLPRADETASMIAQDTAAGGAEAESAPFFEEDASSSKTMDACGEPITSESDSRWSMSFDLETSTVEGTFGAEVSLTNTDVDRPFDGTTTLAPVVIMREGVVVAHGVPVDFNVVTEDSGQRIVWSGTYGLETCDGAPLAPGAYDFRAIVEVTGDEPGLAGERVMSAAVVVEIVG